MKIGDVVKTLTDSPYDVYKAGAVGVIVGKHDSFGAFYTYWFVQFGDATKAKVGCKSRYYTGPEMGVWCVAENNLELLKEAEGMKIGDRIITTEACLGGAFEQDCTGTIVGQISSDNYYVQFDPSPDVDMKHGNLGYQGGTVFGVWAVIESQMRLLSALESYPGDEITELDGYIFTGVKQKEGSEWQPDEAVGNVMDITKGMFE